MSPKTHIWLVMLLCTLETCMAYSSTLQVEETGTTFLPNVSGLSPATRLYIAEDGTLLSYGSEGHAMISASALYSGDQRFETRLQARPVFLCPYPPLWSSDQSSWLQIQRSGFDSRRYQIFWEAVGLERVPLSLVSTIEKLLERKSSGSVLESREYGRRNPLCLPRRAIYQQKLALTHRHVAVARSE
jgi:hypothetical protein